MPDHKYHQNAKGFPQDPLIFAREPVNDQSEKQAFDFPLDDILLYLFDRKRESASKEQIEKLVSSNRAFRERIKLIKQEIRDNEIRTVEEYKKYTKKEADMLATVFLNALNKTYEHLKDAKNSEEISGDDPVNEQRETINSKRPYLNKKEKVL